MKNSNTVNRSEMLLDALSALNTKSVNKNKLVTKTAIAAASVVSLGTVGAFGGNDASAATTTKDVTVKTGDTLSQIAQDNNTTVDKLVSDNNIANRNLIYAKQIIKVITEVPDTTNTTDSDKLQDKILSPILNPTVTSGYGYRDFSGSTEHTGIDLVPTTGDTTVYAAVGGKVVDPSPWAWKGTNGGFGNLVVIQQADGTYAFYGHLDSSYVKPGQVVKAGDKIAQMGSTGWATGPHLHFELRKSVNSVGTMTDTIDPTPYLFDSNNKIVNEPTQAQQDAKTPDKVSAADVAAAAKGNQADTKVATNYYQHSGSNTTTTTSTSTNTIVPSGSLGTAAQAAQMVADRTDGDVARWAKIIQRESSGIGNIYNSQGYYGYFQLAPGYPGNGGDLNAQVDEAVYLWHHGGYAHWAATAY